MSDHVKDNARKDWDTGEFNYKSQTWEQVLAAIIEQASGGTLKVKPVGHLRVKHDLEITVAKYSNGRVYTTEQRPLCVEVERYEGARWKDAIADVRSWPRGFSMAARKCYKEGAEQRLAIAGEWDLFLKGNGSLCGKGLKSFFAVGADWFTALALPFHVRDNTYNQRGIKTCNKFADIVWPIVDNVNPLYVKHGVTPKILYGDHLVVDDWFTLVTLIKALWSRKNNIPVIFENWKFGDPPPLKVQIVSSTQNVTKETHDTQQTNQVRDQRRQHRARNHEPQDGRRP
jgi:hypothetical protein